MMQNVSSGKRDGRVIREEVASHRREVYCRLWVESARRGQRRGRGMPARQNASVHLPRSFTYLEEIPWNRRHIHFAYTFARIRSEIGESSSTRIQRFCPPGPLNICRVAALSSEVVWDANASAASRPTCCSKRNINVCSTATVERSSDQSFQWGCVRAW